MKYLLIINNDPALMPTPGTAEFGEMIAGYQAFGKTLQDRGIVFSGAPLQAPDTGTTVRIRQGKKTTTDGPFAETKEWMAGFYDLDCKDLDEALDLAAQIPGARYGSVEVRPHADMGCADAQTPAAKVAAHK
jgi:hypothetical protein